jgi:hypothetical protein
MHLYAVRGIGSDVWIAGEQGLLLKLDRASGRFAAVPLPYQGTLFGVAGSGRAVLVHGLRGNLLRSTDGGASWQAIPTGVQVGLTAATVDSRRPHRAGQPGRPPARQRRRRRQLRAGQARPALTGRRGAGRRPGRVLVAGPRGVQAQPLP